MALNGIEDIKLRDTRETIPNDIAYPGFDYHFDVAQAKGLSISEAGRYAGSMLLGKSELVVTEFPDQPESTF